MPLRVDTCVAQHIGDRAEQQDRVALIPHPSRKGLLLAVVADGMGGYSGGAIAAEQIVLKARQLFADYAPAGQTPERLLRAVVEESHIVIRLARFTTEQNPHSTAVVLLLQPGRADWANCGDSRVYHFRGGRLASRTADHSFVAELVRQGRINELQALSHPKRSLLMHCLGADQDPRIDVSSAAPCAGEDVFLLCSDGLWTYFSNDELAGVVGAHAPRAAAEILVRRARERAGGQGDNLSLVIIKLVEEPAKTEPPRRVAPPAKLKA